LIYLDSSALVKLVVREAESVPLKEWLAAQPTVPRVSSALVRAEVPRAVVAGGDIAAVKARMVLDDVAQIPLTPGLLDEAGAFAAPLRSLDAIHLVSALRLGAGLEWFVAYDESLLEAAEAVGLAIVAPGAS
jgi:predicted nucleic acid-binding protein